MPGGRLSLGSGFLSLKPTKLTPQEPLSMNGPINGPTPLEHLPSFPVSLRMPRGKVVGFHTQSVESGCGLGNLTTSLPKNPPSQSVFYQNQTETIPERVIERFIAASPPALLWSAPKLIPSSVSGQTVQGGCLKPVRSTVKNSQIFCRPGRKIPGKILLF